MNTRIIFAVVALAASVISASAQYKDLGNKNRFSIGPRFHFNVTADLRTIPLPANLNGGYDDGFVLDDSSKNAGGKTWNWGYQKTNQIIMGAGGREMVLHGIESPRNGVVDKMSGDLQYGLEFSYGREILRLGDPERPKILGIEASFGGSALALSMENTIQGRRFRTEHHFSIPNNIFLPTNAPFVGSFEGPRPPNPPFPLIPTNIVSVGGQMESIRAAQRAEITGSYFGFRLGPFFEVPLSGPWEMQFGAGLALVHVDAKLEYAEKYAVTGTGGPPPELIASEDTHAWLAGFYLEAKVQYWFNPVIAAYIGGQYQMVDELTLRAFGKEATLDFGSAFGLVLGVTYSF